MSIHRDEGRNRRPVKREKSGISAETEGADSRTSQSIEEVCRTARGPISIARLAKRAKVSNRSISIIEDGKLAAEMKAGKDRERKMRTWAFVLSKLAISLNQDPDRWIRLAGIDLSGSELNDIKISARKRIAPSTRSENDTLAKIRSELQTRPDEQIAVHVHFLTSDESTQGQKAFYDRLCKLILRTINPRLEPRPTTEVRTFEAVMEGLSSTPPKHRLCVGAFQMIGRTQHRVSFIPIPGWRIRLGALALPQSQVTWEHIRQSGKGLAPRAKSELRVMVIAQEAGDVYIQSFCEFPVKQILRISDYHIRGAADAFYQELKTNPRTVFILGEYEAAVIRNILRVKHGYDLVDLAAEAESVPRYQLALAAAESDERWVQTLKVAIDELFQNAGAMMAELYGQYMVAVISEAVAGEEMQGEEPRDTIRRILGLALPADANSDQIGSRPGESLRTGESLRSLNENFGDEDDARASLACVPSYLQLHEFEFPVSNAFRHGLHDFVKAELVRRRLIEADEPFAPYFRRLAPWLESEGERTLYAARKIWRQLKKIAAEQESQGALLERVLAHR